MPILINFNSNLADEMAVSGFLITLENKEQIIKQLNN